MAASLKASEKGLIRIEQARNRMGWNIGSAAWLSKAGVSKPTLKRFLAGKPVSQSSFAAICNSVGIEQWEDIAELGLETFSIEPSPELIRNVKNLPQNWNQRSLYLGDGGKNWLSIAEHPKYISVINRNKMRNVLIEILQALQEKIKIETFVSMGPGDADVDYEIVVNLANPQILYLPVDLSPEILQEAFSRIKNHARVPVGILCDFEGEFGFVKQRLEPRIKSPVLIGLLGNILGNLDRYEKTFLNQVKSFLKKGDYLLLDVTIVNSDKYDLASDYQAKPSEHIDEFRRFYAAGVSRQTKRPIEDIIKEYPEKIKSKLCTTDETYSDIPNTLSVEIFFKDKTEVKIVSLRRYHWESLLYELENYFKFEVVEKKPCFFDDKIGSGMVLLKKR